MIRENAYKIKKLRSILENNEFVTGRLFDFTIQEDREMRDILQREGIQVVNIRVRCSMRLKYNNGLSGLFNGRVAIFINNSGIGGVQKTVTVLNKMDLLKGHYFLWGVWAWSYFLTLEKYHKLLELSARDVSKDIATRLLIVHTNLLGLTFSVGFLLIKLIVDLEMIKKNGYN